MPEKEGESHYCLYEDKINSLNESINGNGKEGMKATLIRQEEHIGFIKETLVRIEKKYDDTLNTIGQVDRAFEKYKAECEAEEEVLEKLRAEKKDTEDKLKAHRRWKVGLLITTIVSILGILALFHRDAINYERSQEDNASATKIEAKR